MAEDGFTLSDEDKEELRARLAEQREQRDAFTAQRNVVTETDSPDDAAYDLKKSSEKGIPRMAVAGDREGYKSEDTLAKLERMAKESPKTRTWLDNPDNYALARDEISELSLFEKIAEGFLKTPAALKTIVPASRAAVSGIALDALEQPGLTPIDKALLHNQDKIRGLDEIKDFGSRAKGAVRTPDFSGFRNPFKKNPLKAGRLDELVEDGIDIEGAKSRALVDATKASADLEAQMPTSDDPTVQGYLSGMSSLAQMAPAMAAGLTTRSASAPLSIMGRQVYGQEYADARAEGFEPGGAGLVAGAMSGIERVTEMLPMKILFGSDQIGKNYLKRWVKSQGAEAITEQFATAGQDFVDWQAKHPEKTVEQFIDERPAAAYQTFIATMVASGIMNTAVLGTEKALVDMAERQRQLEMTPGEQTLDKLLTQAGKPKLRKRSPEKMQEFLEQITEGEGPNGERLDTIEIDLQGLAEALEETSQDPTEFLEGLGLPQDALEQAFDMTGMIELPTAKALSSDAVMDNLDVLKPHMRLVGEQHTPQQRRAAQETAQEELKDIVEAHKAIIEGRVEGEVSDANITTQLEDRITQTGMYADPQEITANATVISSMVSWLAKVQGRSAQEVFDEQGPAIMGVFGLGDEQVQMGDDVIMQQAQDNGFEGDDIQGAQEWEAARAKGLDMSTEGRMARAQEMGYDTETVLYHGTGSDISGFDSSSNDINSILGPGTFFTKFPESAEVYAEAQNMGRQPNLIPTFIRGNIVDRATVNIPPPALLLRRAKQKFPDMSEDDAVRAWFREQGIDGLRTENWEEVTVFDPSNIRSVNAAFDPDHADSANLLNQLIGPKAKTADKAILKTAQKMAKETVKVDVKARAIRLNKRLSRQPSIVKAAIGELIDAEVERFNTGPNADGGFIFSAHSYYKNGNVSDTIDALIESLRNEDSPVQDGRGDGPKKYIYSFLRDRGVVGNYGDRSIRKAAPKYTRQQIWDKTAEMGQPWYQAEDGSWISEIEDGVVVVNEGKGKVSEVIEYPALYEQYPQVGEMRADTRSKAKYASENTGDPDVPGTQGTFEERPFVWNPHIRISDQGESSKEYTAIHELTHAVDAIEGRLKSNEPYLLKPTERRAFNVMYRRLWTMEERIATPPWKTEKEAIDWFQGGRSPSAPSAQFAKDGTFDPFGKERREKSVNPERDMDNLPSTRERRADKAGWGEWSERSANIAGRSFISLKEAERSLGVDRDDLNLIDFDARMDELPTDVVKSFEKLLGQSKVQNRTLSIPDSFNEGDTIKKLLMYLSLGRGGKDSIKRITRLLMQAGFDGFLYQPGGRSRDTDAPPSFPSVFILDPDAPSANMVDGALYQSSGGTAGNYSPSQNAIRLFEAKNVSTLMHESAHWFLDTLEKINQSEQAPAEITAMLESIRAWHGMPADQSIYDENGVVTPEGRELHEAFAETFEVYLRSGKAPNAKLREAFRFFKQWLTQLYKKVAGNPSLTRANLNPEITDIFDRILGVEDAVDVATSGIKVEAQIMVDQMLESGVLTEREHARAKERLANAIEEVKEEWTAKLFDEAEKRHKAWEKGERRILREEAIRDFDRSDVGRAEGVLGRGEWMGDVVTPSEADTLDQTLSSMRHVMRMTDEEAAQWYAESITESVQDMGNGTTRIGLSFRLTDAADAPYVDVPIMVQDGVANVDILLNGQMSGALEGDNKHVSGMQMFAGVVTALRHRLMNEDVRAIKMPPLTPGHRKLYGFMLAHLRFDGFVPYITTQETSSISLEDGVYSAEPIHMGADAVFHLVREGVDPNEFAGATNEKTLPEEGASRFSVQTNFERIPFANRRSDGVDAGRQDAGQSDTGSVLSETVEDRRQQAAVAAFKEAAACTANQTAGIGAMVAGNLLGLGVAGTGVAIVMHATDDEGRARRKEIADQIAFDERLRTDPEFKRAYTNARDEAAKEAMEAEVAREAEAERKRIEAIYSDVDNMPTDNQFNMNGWAEQAVGVDAGFLDDLIGHEAADDWSAANPESSARGGAQFIESTWFHQMAKHGPQHGADDPHLAEAYETGRDIARRTGRSEEREVARAYRKLASKDEQKVLLDLREDRRWGTMVAAHFTRDNVEHLERATGKQINHKQAYLAHFLGVDTAVKALRANPEANAAEMFPAAAAANQNVFYKRGNLENPRTVKEMIARQGGNFSSAPALIDHEYLSLEDAAVSDGMVDREVTS